jgi:uncharacterized protein (DUF433 family)
MVWMHSTEELPVGAGPGFGRTGAEGTGMPVQVIVDNYDFGMSAGEVDEARELDTSDVRAILRATHRP